eukprot:SAG31_NODE_3409_length_4306_cov_1.917281_4_plen_92_part_00
MLLDYAAAPYLGRQHSLKRCADCEMWLIRERADHLEAEVLALRAQVTKHADDRDRDAKLATVLRGEPSRDSSNSSTFACSSQHPMCKPIGG